MRDDEAPKLLLESIEPAPSLSGFGKSTAAPAPEYTAVSYIGHSAAETDSPAPVAAARMASAAAVAEQPRPAASAQKRTHGLFLRFASESDGTKQQALNRITAFEGSTPVYFYFNDSKKYDLKTGITAGISAQLLASLKQLLGDKNVVLQ